MRFTEIAFLGFALAAIPAPVGAQRALTFSAPSQLVETLRNGAGSQRKQLDRELGWRFMPHQTCTAKTWRAQLERGEMGTVMRVNCDAGEVLAVLGRMRGGRWQYEGSAGLWDPGGGKLKVELIALVDPPVEEIVVHNNQVENGTGVWQGDLMVFKVIGHRLRKVLDTVEYSHLKQWTKPFHEVDQQSTFKFILASKDQPAEVDEVQTITTDTAKVVLERSFQWSKRTDTFDPSQWYSARVTENSKAPRAQ